MIKNTKLILMSILILGLISSVTFANPINLMNANAQTNPYSLVAFSGDWSCNTQATNSFTQVKNSNVDALIVLGDTSYGSSLNCFSDLIESNGLKSKTYGAIGNHDSSEDGSASLESQLKSYFGLDSNGNKVVEISLGNTGQKAVFIILNSQQSISSGSAQYTYLEQTLKSLEQRTDVKYVFTAFHKLAWNCGSSCSSHGIEVSGDFKNLVYSYGKTVDAVLQAHEHHFAQSKIMKTGNIVTDNKDINGVTYYVAGLAGRSADGASSPNAETLTAFGGSSNHGIAYLKLYHNEEKIDSYFKTNSGTVKAESTILDISGTIPIEICGDGIDNDNDGLIDENCVEICGNGIDDDLDGLIDEGCNVIEVCGDGIDNDGDGKIDAEDPDCPLVPEICNNGLDDDRDGLKDGNDPDCQQQELTKINIISSSATAQDSGKESQKSYDGDCTTRWSGNGIGTSITLNFDGPYLLKKILIDGYHADKSYKFKIKDGANANKEYLIPTPRSTCTTLTEFDISDQNINASSLTIIGLGNSGTDYNSYREIQVFGVKGTPIPVEICGDGIDNDNDGLVDENCPIPPPKPKLAFNITSIIEGNESKIPQADLKLNETEFTIYPTQNNTKITILGNTTVLPTSAENEIITFPHTLKIQPQKTYDPNLKSVNYN